METKLSNKRKFEVISRDKEFLKHYLNNYFDRLLGSNDINKEYIKSLFISFNNGNRENIFLNMLIEFADSINELTSKTGLRNYDYSDNNQIFVPVKKEKIFQKFYSLIDSYRGLWKDLHELDREAYFHIHLMRIYPFMNNNELICSLILMSNLMNCFYPPFIISKSEKDNYYQMITSGDALKFKEFILKKIEEEFIIIEELYKKYYLFPDNVSLEEIIIKKTNLN